MRQTVISVDHSPARVERSAVAAAHLLGLHLPGELPGAIERTVVISGYSSAKSPPQRLAYGPEAMLNNTNLPSIGSSTQSRGSDRHNRRFLESRRCWGSRNIDFALFFPY